MNNELYQRIRGVLIGGALGDAYGMPTEFFTRRQIKEKFPEGICEMLPSLNPGSFIQRDLPAGSVTDDTINAVMILNSIISNKGSINTQQYIDSLIDWIKKSSDAQLVCGPSTLRAVKAIQAGESFEKTGFGSTTNGASMKISPIGIISDYNNLNDLMGKVYQICLPTHNTAIAMSGACVVAACVSYVISGGNSIDELWDLAMKVAGASSSLGAEFPSPSLTWRISHARNIVKNSDFNDAIERIVNEIGTGVETIETIPSVLAVIHLANGEPTRAAQIGAALGADTDTIGAISASICGGMEAMFEEEDISKLEKVNNIDFNGLTSDIYQYCPFAKG